VSAGGDDLMFGGAGDDWLLGDGGDDFIDGGADNDVAFGESGRRPGPRFGVGDDVALRR
jgi:Ca2+-binding RTX toxin-like protein